MINSEKISFKLKAIKISTFQIFESCIENVFLFSGIYNYFNEIKHRKYYMLLQVKKSIWFAEVEMHFLNNRMSYIFVPDF